MNRLLFMTLALLVNFCAFPLTGGVLPYVAREVYGTDQTGLGYLAEMLVSFVKINSFTIPIRVRKGVWRKFRFSDFDINSLIKYSQMIEQDQRYHPYKRIADICLFTIGIF